MGVAKNAPKFGAAAVSSSGRSTKAGVERTQTGDSVFELWLAPGVYSLRVEAGGYADLELQRLEVRAGHDLRIDLEFSR